MPRLVLYTFLIIILIFVISFSVLNSQAVELNYYVGSQSMPLALLLVLVLSLGVVLGVMAMLRTILRLRMEVTRLKRSVKLSEQELNAIRSLPVKDR